MNQQTPSSPAVITSLHFVGLEQARQKRGWFLAMGILLVVLGAAAVGWSVAATIASVLFVGWMMIISGILEFILSFGIRGWGGFFLSLLSAVLSAVAGLLIVANPGVAAAALTLVIAMFLVFGGIFRITCAIMLSFPHRGWLVFYGAVNVLLGVLIWKQWPVSGLWVIGLFIGIDMLMNGASLIMLSLALKDTVVKDQSVESSAV